MPVYLSTPFRDCDETGATQEPACSRRSAGLSGPRLGLSRYQCAIPALRLGPGQSRAGPAAPGGRPLPPAVLETGPQAPPPNFCVTIAEFRVTLDPGNPTAGSGAQQVSRGAAPVRRAPPSGRREPGASLSSLQGPQRPFPVQCHPGRRFSPFRRPPSSAFFPS